MAKFYHLVPERGYVFPRDSDGTPTIEHQKQTKMTNPLFRAMLHYVRIPYFERCYTMYAFPFVKLPHS